MGSRRRSSVVAAIGVLVGVILVLALGTALRTVAALTLLQFPISSVTVISDPPPPDLPGQFSEATWLQGNPLDPNPAWRLPTFDDSGWSASYPAATLPGWGAPLGDAGLGADFIWGGPPGADVGGRYEIPTSPDPQFLFLRKNFCIPINADASSIQATSQQLRIQIAATPGDAVISYNGVDVGSLRGLEDGTVYTVDLAPAVAAARRLGRNTLAMSVNDDVDDAYGAVAYRVDFSYGINPAAITVHWDIPSGVALPGVQINFSQGGTGPGGDGPHTYAWDFGDGTFSADPAPVKVYGAAGTYTVTLTMTDRFGCPSAPVLAQLVVAEPTATPTPTNAPTPTDTPLPTDTPVPPPTNTPRPRNTSAPSEPQPAPTSTPSILPTLTPTLVAPILLPETGLGDQGLWVPMAVAAAGAMLAIALYFLHRRRATRRDV
jgi:cell division septation protein DedD